jgi:predicted chitinase
VNKIEELEKKINALEDRIYSLESLLNVYHERTIDVDANREYWGEEPPMKTVYRCKLGCVHDTIKEASEHVR